MSGIIITWFYNACTAGYQWPPITPVTILLSLDRFLILLYKGGGALTSTGGGGANINGGGGRGWRGEGVEGGGMKEG